MKVHIFVSNTSYRIYDELLINPFTWEKILYFTCLDTDCFHIIQM